MRYCSQAFQIVMDMTWGGNLFKMDDREAKLKMAEEIFDSF